MPVKYSTIMPVRKWERYPGNNRFYCNGLLMSANQIGILVFIVVVICVVAVLYFAFDARFLITHIKPVGVAAAVPAVGALLLFYGVMFILKTGCIDPGIVPRAHPDEVAYQAALADEDPSTPNRPYTSRYKTVTVNGQRIKLKWCATCNLWRPPRASHCGLCNNCYENFDHHCPWVGNCVAKRNYRYFYLFLVSVTIGCVYVMGCNVAVIVIASREDNFGEALKTYPASVIEFCICGLSVVSVSGLAAMHTWLIGRMETTNEDIKGTYNPRKQGRGVRNPYRKNCCYNFSKVVCGPFPPSLIDRRGFIDPSIIVEDGEGYGATTSSAPKLPPESQCPYPVQPAPVSVTTHLTLSTADGGGEIGESHELEVTASSREETQVSDGETQVSDAPPGPTSPQAGAAESYGHLQPVDEEKQHLID